MCSDTEKDIKTDIKPANLTWNEASNVGRNAIDFITSSFALKCRDGAMFSSQDDMSLLLLADLVGYSPETGDAISRLMGTMGSELRLPSADTALAALNATDASELMSQFRHAVVRQLQSADAVPDGYFIVAGDTHDVKRYSKKGVDASGRKRKADDLKYVSGTKPERSCSYAHKFITLESAMSGYTLDMHPHLPLSELPSGVSMMLDRTEAACGRHIPLLLYDAAGYSAPFVTMLRRRKTDFIIRAPKNSAIKKLIAGRRGTYGAVIRDYQIDGDADAPVNLVIVSTELLRKHRMKLPLVDRKEKWITLAADLSPAEGEEDTAFMLRIARLYGKRWSVETSYRCIEDFHGETHSLHYQARYLLFAIAVLLYNAWVQCASAVKMTKYVMAFAFALILLDMPALLNIVCNEAQVSPGTVDPSVPPDGGGNM